MLRQPKSIGRPTVAVAAGIVMAGAAAVGYAATRPPDHDFGAVPAASATTAMAGRAPQTARGHPGQDGLAGITMTAVPARLRIPAIGVNAPVVPVGVAADGTLGIPASPAVVGWWAGGGSPGRTSGATVLVGHVDSAARGPGALFRLQQLRPGSVVTVTAGGRTWRYVVRAVRAYDKARLPAAAVFGQQVTPRLVIITCGGPFDAATGHYLDNIVVYAVPAWLPSCAKGQSGAAALRWIVALLISTDRAGGIPIPVATHQGNHHPAARRAHRRPDPGNRRLPWRGPGPGPDHRRRRRPEVVVAVTASQTADLRLRHRALTCWPLRGWTGLG